MEIKTMQFSAKEFKELVEKTFEDANSFETIAIVTQTQRDNEISQSVTFTRRFDI